jgi:RimJ/RimL family protein N-acetyltransferase
MSETRDIEIRMAIPSDIGPVLDHLKRSRADKGRKGSMIYGFQFDTPLNEIGWETNIWNLNERPLDIPGWRRAFLAFDKENVIGTCSLTSENMQFSQHRVVLGINIEHGYRNRGLGRRLMESVIAWTRSHTKVEWIDLGVFSTNKRAIALYKSFGFLTWGVRKDRFRSDGTSLNDVSMSLRIAGEELD